MPRPEAGAAIMMSRRPNRIALGVVLLIGLSLAWYWLRHDHFALELGAADASVRFTALPRARG